MNQLQVIGFTQLFIMIFKGVAFIYLVYVASQLLKAAKIYINKNK